MTNDPSIIKYLIENHTIEIRTDLDSISIPEINVDSKKRIRANSKDLSITFAEVLQARTSTRQFNPVESTSVLSALYLSARAREVFITESGYLRSSRPHASAGGRHPSEILLIVNAISGLERGIWYFDPFRAELLLTNLPESFLVTINGRVNELIGTTAPGVLVSVSVLRRTLSRYKNGLSLIWRDAGNLMSTLSLACSANNISSCQLGLSEEFLLGELLGLKKEPLWITGALAIG
jgi:SagB-type dehydrogenase family enzyme